jgi:hypothetical protein
MAAIHVLHKVPCHVRAGDARGLPECELACRWTRLQ